MNRITKIALSAVTLGFVGMIAAAPLTAGEPTGDDLWKDKRAKCNMCHGDDGKSQTAMGKKAGAPDMTSDKWQKGIKDEQILTAILKGFEHEKDGKKFKHKGLKDGTEAEGKALLGKVRSFGAAKK